MRDKILALIVIFFVAGCAWQYQNYKWMKVEGKEIKTPYGKAKADMYYSSSLCFPKCESLTSAVLKTVNQTEGEDEKDNVISNAVVGD